MSSVINADTSDGLKLTSDTSGEIKLQSAGTDIATVSSTGITMASGKAVSGGEIIQNAGPAFRAYLNADQTGISSATWTKVQIDTEEFDTNSCYDNSTNYRFTPTIAGYYQINFRVRNDSTSTRASDFAAIYKNGSLYSYANTALFSTAADVGINGSDLIYFNGSTDYIEIYTFLNGASGNVDGGATGNTFVSGFLARAE